MCLTRRFMFDLPHCQDHDRAGLTPHAVHMISATWIRLATADLSHVRTMSELIGKVEESDSLTHEQATRDVEFWALDKRL